MQDVEKTEIQSQTSSKRRRRRNRFRPLYGLLVAILMIRGAASTKNAKDGTAENYGMDGMSLGMCFGLLISVMFGDYTCVGLSIGMLLGMAVGLSVHKE